MKKIGLTILALLLFSTTGCALSTAGPAITATYTLAAPTKTYTPVLTSTPFPSATQPSVTPSKLAPTPTPEEFPQIYIGIQESDVQIGACGSGKTIWTMNYGGEGEEISFWDFHPELPRPSFSEIEVVYGTRDWRGNMDICVYPARPIVAQHQGFVKENRTQWFTPEKQDCLMAIDLGPDGMDGITLILAHYNPDTDPDSDRIQSIEPGTVITPGTVIGYTHQKVINGITENPVLNVGLFNSNSHKTTNFDYWADQDLSLIGEDGQVNLIRP